MDKPVENLSIGAINPHALTEALLRRKIDWNDPQSIKSWRIRWKPTIMSCSI